MTELVILGIVTALVGVVAWWWRRRDGAVRTAVGALGPQARSKLGVPTEGWALVEFTAPGCTACAAARQVLDEVADHRRDVTVTTVDVATAPELARDHRVLRAPTTLVVDEHGAIRARVGGVPDAGDLAAVLAGPAASRAGS